MPSRAEFAASLKAKYPAYKDVPDDQLVDAMLAKYPVYKDQVDSYAGTPGLADSVARLHAHAAGGIVPPQKHVNDAGEEVDAPAGPLGNFFRNTIRNPMAEGAAHPTSTGDVASLLLPDATLGAGNLRLPNLLSGMKRVVNAAGKASADGPLLSAPLRFVKAGVKEAGATPTDLFNRLPLAEQMNRLPEVAAPVRGNSVPPQVDTPSFDSRPLAEQMAQIPDVPSPIGKTPVPPVRMSTSRVPDVRLAGKAPTVTDSLHDALLEALNSKDAATLSTAAPDVTTAGEGALVQSGKFGRSGSLGQPGGYTSGRPAISDAEYDAMLKKFGGKAKTPSLLPGDASPSVDATDWHSGAEPGSAEATSAHSLHKATGEMDSAFKAKMNDPLASLLLTALLGGGSAGAMMSSHGTQ